MAKHPHRLMLVNNKTWRCTLEGCGFFVHSGLSYILPGKNAVCWECGEVFTLDEYALRDEMPKCIECRMPNRITSQITSNETKHELDIDDYLQISTILNQNGIEYLIELGLDKVRALQDAGELPENIPEMYMGKIPKSESGE